MDFAEKAQRLMGERKIKDVAYRARIGPTLLSKYLRGKATPTARSALMLSKVFDVPLDWLVDETEDWPPPRETGPSAGNLSDGELMHELARRFRLEMMRGLEELDRIEAFDWRSAAFALYTQGISSYDHQLYERVAELLQAYAALRFAVDRYNLDSYVRAHHNILPGGDRFDFDELTPERFQDRVWGLSNRNLYFRFAREFSNLVAIEESDPNMRDTTERLCRDYLQRLRQIDKGGEDQAAGE